MSFSKRSFLAAIAGAVSGAGLLEADYASATEANPDLIDVGWNAAGYKPGPRTFHLGTNGYGATPSSAIAAAANTTAIFNLLGLLNSLGGGQLVIDDVYYINSTVYTAFAHDLTITFLPGAKLIGATGFAQPLLWTDSSGTDGTQTGTLIINNPNVDCSAGNAPGNQPSALHMSYWKNVLVNEPMLYGGTTYTNTNADSGIEPVDCLNFMCLGGIIEGFSDAGIYNGGDNTLTDLQQGLNCIVNGTTFRHCNVGAESKRAYHNTMITNCLFSYCNTGAVTAFVSGAQQLLPGRKMQVSNNRFEFISSQAINFNGGSTGMISDNVIEDFGYLEDGVTASSATVAAIFANGASGLTINNNDIKMTAWAANGTQYGILTATVTQNAVLYTGGNHNCKGNNYKGLTACGVDAASTVSSQFIDETIQNIAGYSGTAATAYRMLNTSRAEYLTVNSGLRTINIGGTIYTAVHEQFHFKTSGILFSSIGVLATGLQSSAISVTATGALNGDTVVVTNMDAAGMNAKLTYVARAITDTAQVQWFNNTGGNIDFTAIHFAVEVWRRDNT